jgi:predicted metal-dependent enzyme (double-stranded beta helix superfamily)
MSGNTSAKILYRPLGLVAGVTGGIIAGAVFKQVWKKVAGEDEAPDATDRNRGWGEVLLGAAVQGAIFGAVKALMDRGGAEGFARLTGDWPGDE